jgi:hypothetical protein
MDEYTQIRTLNPSTIRLSKGIRVNLIFFKKKTTSLPCAYSVYNTVMQPAINSSITIKRLFLGLNILKPLYSLFLRLFPGPPDDA